MFDVSILMFEYLPKCELNQKSLIQFSTFSEEILLLRMSLKVALQEKKTKKKQKR